MYDHFPDHMKDFYNSIFAWVDAAPNCQFVGSLSQADMRRTLKGSVAYVYPTAFEETSCIIARECIETLTPMLSTGVGALTETLGDCGIFYEDWTERPISESPQPLYDDDEWCKDFAEFVRASLTEDHPESNLKATMWAVHEMTKRTDLYWDGVAAQVIENAEPKQPTHYSRAWSMVQDGDVIPAEAYLAALPMDDHNEHSLALLDEIHTCYPFVFGDVTMEEHYNLHYEIVNKNELEWTVQYTDHPRINEVRAALKSMPPGSLVMEYGCGAGHMIAPLAIEFPLLNFVGMDINQPCVDVINKGAKENKVKNLRAVRGDQDHPVENYKKLADFIWCSEVLEHVVEPWALVEEVESYAQEGGYALFTVPFGPWDVMTFMRPGQWMFRAHIWQVDKDMIKKMVGEKDEISISSCASSSGKDGRVYGNYIFSFKVDHKGVPRVDPLEKAKRHFSRQTVAAAVIAMDNSDTIEKLLNSLKYTVQHVNIAHGPSKDNTRQIIDEWFKRHPYVTYKVIDVPPIHTPEGYRDGWGQGFGFDDARNVSTRGLEAYDWMLWIDTDEYLVGNLNPFLRANALDSYLITQHHFTVEPRGEPAQLDRPARLIRTTSGFTARGHIHEHFEVPEGGPGRGFLLPSVDIGHTGYENEETRRARFFRNFPFLQWDHDTASDRRLHPFLWFRDIVHRVRYALSEGNNEVAFHLAQEGIEYYNDHWNEMSSFGPGTFQALDYIAELNRYLDKGLGVQLQLVLEDGKTLAFNSKVESFDQLERVLRDVLEPEYKTRNSRYY
jgi:SAM-dependent methyltransferase